MALQTIHYIERPRRDLSTYAGRRYIHVYPNEPQPKDMFLANGDIFVVLSHMDQSETDSVSETESESEGVCAVGDN